MSNKATTDIFFIKKLLKVMWAAYAVAIVTYMKLGTRNIFSTACIGVTGGLLVYGAVLLILWRTQHNQDA